MASYNFICVAHSNSNMGILTQTKHKIKTWLYGINNKKPIYRVTRSGQVEVKYVNPVSVKELPLDRESYERHHVFIGNWANPWEFDIDEIEKHYDNFTEDTITKVEDVFAKEHIYPLQRYKLIVNQTALQDMYAASSLNNQAIMRLLYAAIIGIGFIGLLIIFGGT